MPLHSVSSPPIPPPELVVVKVALVIPPGLLARYQISTRLPEPPTPVALTQPDGPENGLDALRLARTATSKFPAVLAAGSVGEIDVPLPLASVPVCTFTTAARAAETPNVSAAATSGQTTSERRSARRVVSVATIGGR